MNLTPAETSLLTKIVTGSVTQEDFFAVSPSYGAMNTFLSRIEVYDVLSSFGLRCSPHRKAITPFHRRDDNAVPYYLKPTGPDTYELV
jgi:hypothetical protein